MTRAMSASPGTNLQYSLTGMFNFDFWGRWKMTFCVLVDRDPSSLHRIYLPNCNRKINSFRKTFPTPISGEIRTPPKNVIKEGGANQQRWETKVRLENRWFSFIGRSPRILDRRRSVYEIRRKSELICHGQSNFPARTQIRKIQLRGNMSKRLSTLFRHPHKIITSLQE